LEALYILALGCGLRQGELLGLRWEDIDLDARRLTVRYQLQRRRDGSGLALVPPKNGKARIIRLGAKGIETLRDHQKRQADERQAAASLWQDRGLVFTTKVGTPLDASNVVNRSYTLLLERAGLRYRNFHALRHTCASLLLHRGKSFKVIQEILGHSGISVTMDTYGHLFPDAQDDAASAMDDALS
jgi:integrase